MERYRVCADHQAGDNYFEETFLDETAAEKHAAKLRKDGYDVTIEVELAE